MPTTSLPLDVAAVNTDLAGMIAAGCLAAGAILTVIGTWQRTVVQRLLDSGKRATAVAGESVHVANPAGGTGHLVWRFQTDDGVYVEHPGLADALHHPTKGDTAKLIYDPVDPRNARLATFEERILAWALFFFAGLALLTVGLIATVVTAINL
ncbi:MAG: DUF3592 domain-containing protein [Aquihabitans sp.]